MNNNIEQPKYLLVKAPKNTRTDYSCIKNADWTLAIQKTTDNKSRLYNSVFNGVQYASLLVDLANNIGDSYLKDDFWQVAYPVSREELVSIINKTPKSAFLSVTFVKKDGTDRKLVGRRDVKRHLVNPEQPKKPTVDVEKYWIFFEAKEKQYRAVSKETVKEAVIAGKHYIVWDIKQEKE